MGQALYRKYRSRSLSEIVGQEHITGTLARALKAGRVGHAYLFTGPRGTGKTSVARILAYEINKLPYADTPHLDIIEIDAASNRRIDDIRDLREKVHIAPVSATYKVYIIDEAHMLTGESFNALLKTLEEPPGHVVFILATTEVHKLPATIISRTQRYTFRPGSLQQVAGHLKQIAKKENIAIDAAALELIAERSEGGFRDSLSLLDQLAHISDQKITAKDVEDALGLAPKEQVTALSQAVVAADTKQIVAILQVLGQQATNTVAVVDQLTKLLLAAAVEQPHLYRLIDQLLEVPRAYNPQLKLLAVLASAGVPGPIAHKQLKDESKNSALLATAPSVTIASATSRTLKAAEKKPSPEPALPPAPTEPLETIQPTDWAQVLDKLKAKNPPLYAVVKQAQPLVQDKALILTFKFALHGKKIEDPKQKAAIAAVLQEVLGKTPVIRVATNKDAVPPVMAKDPAVAKVAAIMGGGELM